VVANTQHDAGRINLDAELDRSMNLANAIHDHLASHKRGFTNDAGWQRESRACRSDCSANVKQRGRLRLQGDGNL
jgi:hypothetical protein